jgi:hypothetical protein
MDAGTTGGFAGTHHKSFAGEFRRAGCGQGMTIDQMGF